MKKLSYITFLVLTSILMVGMVNAYYLDDTLSITGVTTCSGDGLVYTYPIQSLNPAATLSAYNDELLIFSRSDMINNIKLFLFSPNFLYNGYFEDETNNWEIVKLVPSSVVSFYNSDGVGVLNISVLGNNYVQNTNLLTLESGKTYRITFDAKSSNGRNIKTFVYKNGTSKRYTPLPDKFFDVTTSWQTFTYDFVPNITTSSVSDAIFAFDMSDDVNNTQFYIDNVKVSLATAEVPLETVVQSNTPFGVKILKATVVAGEAYDVTGTSNNGSRAIQAYIIQDSDNPIYNISAFTLVYNGDEVNSMYLEPGDYQFPIFDKHTKDSLTGSLDFRTVSFTLVGDNYYFSQSYNEPNYDGVVLADFSVTEPGYYNVSISGDDPVYWGKVVCENPAEDPEEIPEVTVLGAAAVLLAGIGIIIYRRKH